jgi:carbonic anhydrase
MAGWAARRNPGLTADDDTLMSDIMENDMAFKRLVDGFTAFRTQYYPQHLELYEKLASEGQSPKILIVGCSDARVDPAILTQTQPGDLFVIRNVGAIVPPIQRDHQFHGTSSAMEFAVRALEVEHIVILGHALCGALGALIEGRDSPFAHYDFLFNWVRIAQPAKTAVLEAIGQAPVDYRRRAIEQASVLNTVANLMTFDWLVERVQAGKLSVHAWYFDLTVAQLWSFDPKAEQFQKVDGSKLPVAAVQAAADVERSRSYMPRFVEVAKAGF